jgi:uncharacterized protein
VPTPTIRTVQPGPLLQVGSLRGYAIRHVTLPIDSLPTDFSGLRIVHVSDCHFENRWTAGHDRLVESINAIGADLICHTGDWVEDKFDYRAGLRCVRRFAEQVRSRLGTYSILGNHDGDLLAGPLVDAGVQLINGAVRRIVGGGGALELVGVAGVAREDCHPAFIESLGPKAPMTVRVVLAHFPDTIRKLAPIGADILLAGHTHGGQVCLPGGKPIITHDSLPKSQSSGVFRIDSTWVHLTRGIGTSAWPVRLFCPPEFSVIELAAADDRPR